MRVSDLLLVEDFAAKFAGERVEDLLDGLVRVHDVVGEEVEEGAHLLGGRGLGHHLLGIWIDF